MQTEAENFSKDDLDSQLAAIEAIKRSEVPTRLVRGKVRPVNVTNHKRKLRKQAIRIHQEKLIALAVAPLIAGGYPDATGIMKFGRLVISLQAPPVEEGI